MEADAKQQITIVPYASLCPPTRGSVGIWLVTFLTLNTLVLRIWHIALRLMYWYVYIPFMPREHIVHCL